MALHPMIESKPVRDAEREMFGVWLSSEISAQRGARAILVKAFGETRVSAWLGGESIPNLDGLIELSELLGTDLSNTLRVAGRPRNEILRARCGIDPRGSFPMLLREWRDQNGYDGKQAAQAVGIAYQTWTRCAAGSKIPGRSVMIKLSAAMDVSVSELVSATQADAGIVVEDRSDAPVAKFLRTAASKLGSTAKQATELGYTSRQWVEWIHGTSTPGVEDIIHVCAMTDTNIKLGLIESGMNPRLASKVAAAYYDKRKAKPVPFGEMVRTARLSKAGELTSVNGKFQGSARAGKNTGWSTSDCAAKLGLSRWAWLSIEQGEVVPDLERCEVISKMLEIPFGELLQAVGHI